MLPDPPVELMPAIEPILRVAPGLKTKIPGPFMRPALVMVRSPSQKKVKPPPETVTVPAMVPEAVEASLKFNLDEAAPRVRVFPEATVKLVVTVKGLGELEPAKVQLPFIVKLFRLVLGTAVMAND